MAIRPHIASWLPTIGLGFWQAWWMCTSSSSVVIGPIQRIPSAMIVLLIATLFGYIVAILVAPRYAPYGINNALVIGAGVCGVIGTLCLSLATNYGSAPQIAIFLEWGGAALVAVFSSLVLLMWGERWSTLSAGNVGKQLVLSFVLAFVFYYATVVLPWAIGLIIVCVLPALSVAALLASRAEPSRTDVPVSSISIKRCSIVATLLALTLISVAFGVMQHVYTFESDNDHSAISSMIIAGLCILIFAIYMLSTSSVSNPFVFYRPIVPTTICGAAICLVVAPQFTSVGNGIFIFGIYCLDMFVMFASTDLAYRAQMQVALVFGSVIIATRAGTLIGSMLGTWIQKAWFWSPDVRIQILAVVIMLCALVGTTMLTESRLRSLYQPEIHPQTLNLDERCARIGAAAGLTARELEVLKLLARGRSLAVIGDTLGIAIGTVKHHVSNTYRKLGVYDRQELIDLVEKQTDSK